MLTHQQLESIRKHHLQVQQYYNGRGKVPPVKYDAWSAPENSMMYKMRGMRGCEKCGGNGFYWFEVGLVWGWIRCTDCRLKFVTAGEI